MADQSIALYQVLGGGWDTQLPAIDDESTAEVPPSTPAKFKEGKMSQAICDKPWRPTPRAR